MKEWIFAKYNHITSGRARVYSIGRDECSPAAPLPVKVKKGKVTSSSAMGNRQEALRAAVPIRTQIVDSVLMLDCLFTIASPDCLVQQCWI